MYYHLNKQAKNVN